ncbi:unnamed protein product [Calicophoron daubneyi]|uniref:Exportin-4 n=1 Tax=Calicophoron daubneyi TaxID=300641 RepID=A0AAV2T5E5_CALDB
MDSIIAELEQAAAVQATASRAEERKNAEDKILQFRSYKEPYDLCALILTKSSNDYLLYEAGRCLSCAVVTEWDSVFAPSTGLGDNAKAFQLLNFILHWAGERGEQVSSAARQRVLGAAGALVKRAAAAHAVQIASAWRSANADTVAETVNSISRRTYRHRVLTNPPDDPGPPCPIMLRLVEHIESLIRPALDIINSPDSLNQKIVWQRCLLGLCIISALLDELSNSEDSTQLDLPLEAHIFMRARFQDFELVRLFTVLLCLIDQAVNNWGKTDLCSLNTEQSSIVFRLVNCLDSVTSWDFLPRELVGFYAARLRRSDCEHCFRPSVKWAPVFGCETLPTTVSLLAKLHTWVRSSDMLGTRTLSCLVRLSSMTGPLTDPVTPLSGLTDTGSNETPSLEENNQPSSMACLFHILVFMEHVNYWFSDDETSQSSLLEHSAVFLSLPPQHQKVIRDECFKRLADPLSLPRIPLDQLFGYELPILSELIQNLVLRNSQAWDPAETALGLPAAVAAGRKPSCDPQTIYQYAFIALVVIDRFFHRICALIIQSLTFLAKNAADTDGDGQLAHEAVERLFNSWVYLVESTPPTGSEVINTNGVLGFQSPNGNWSGKLNNPIVPMPLTTGESSAFEQQTLQVTHLLHILVEGVSRLQVRLSHTYLISKLACPVGMRVPYSDQNEDIDLELDEDDLTASEDSLFGAGFCGLAAADDYAHLLLRLVDERVSQLVAAHDHPPDQVVVDIYEDLHWILLVTGHFLVSGPASLASVVRSGSQWDTEFSISSRLLELGSGTSVNVTTSRQFLSLAAGRCIEVNDPWPPVGISLEHVPSLVRLFCSLFRLLWLQVNAGAGSAQLVEDNFWLMTRIAVAYFCYGVIDRDAFMINKSQSPILSIIQGDSSDPSPAHRGVLTSYQSKNFPSEQTSHVPNGSGGPTNVSRVWIQGLLTCARLALIHWSSEPQVLTALTRLLGVLSRHAPNPSTNLACPAWFEICSLLCGSNAFEQTWPHLSTESLIELIDSCLCGSWAIDKDRLALSQRKQGQNGDTNTLLYELLHSLRDRLFQVLNYFSQPCTTNSTVNSQTVDVLANCVAALRGVARAVGTLATQSESNNDLVSLVWSGLIVPTLDTAANVLVVRCHSCSDLIQGLLSLFSEVADSCLIYLANLPSGPLISTKHSPAEGDHEKGEGNANTQGRVASAVFLDLTMIICRNYAKQNANESNFEAAAEDDRIAELRLLLTLLSRILAHEFELRLSTAVVLPNNSSDLLESSKLAETNGPARAVDVAIISLGYLLPLITEPALMVPELCHAFYSLASYASELSIECLAHLSDEQLTYFGRLLRLGIFGSAPNSFPASTQSGPFSGVDSSIAHQCLEIVNALADHCLSVRAHTKADSSTQLQTACRLSTILGLNTELLTDLFALLTRTTYSVDLETTLSSAILSLIHLSREAYIQLVCQWLTDCPDPNTRERLDTAFEHLGRPTDHADNIPDGPSRYIEAFDDRKPTRTGRLDFQQRFHTFAAELRAFVCRS